jgi:hypothetical protein
VPYLLCVPYLLLQPTWQRDFLLQTRPAQQSVSALHAALLLAASMHLAAMAAVAHPGWRATMHAMTDTRLQK